VIHPALNDLRADFVYKPPQFNQSRHWIAPAFEPERMHRYAESGNPWAEFTILRQRNHMVLRVVRKPPRQQAVERTLCATRAETGNYMEEAWHRSALGLRPEFFCIDDPKAPLATKAMKKTLPGESRILWEKSPKITI